MPTPSIGTPGKTWTIPIVMAMSMRAIKLLDRAVELDPQSAASYAALSEAYEDKNIFNPDAEWTKLASEYADKAVRVDDYLAAGHVSLGVAKMKR